MTGKGLFFLFLLITGSVNLTAQLKKIGVFPLPSPANEITISPGGLMDNIFDQFGKKYRLEDLIIKQPLLERFLSPPTSSTQPQSLTSFTSCNSGYFKLYFETGCGMEGNSAIEISRRDVICQVFSDLSQFINSPLSVNGGKVNIFIRDMVNMGVSNPSSNSTLGLGSTFYSLPAVQNIGGIADNLIWQTIVSGTDAYTNVANPLTTPLVGGGNFYHGMLSFNFSNPGVAWHTQLSSMPSSSEFDLYSVVLHEITHAMGFGSLIDQNGLSKTGPTFPYYSRYDSFLKTQNNISLLAQSTGTCANSRYGWYWNSALSTNILQPGFTNINACIPDNTNCNSAINFVGSATQPVYTPNCFSGGSTLSHFEDQCSPPIPGNNLYFVMSNANSTGPQYMKRYFKPEERKALCDIGYSCNNTYGNSGNLSICTYTGALCPGAEVAGINDGLDLQGFYTLIGNINSTIPIAGILLNDRFTSNIGNTFKCLEVISGSGNLSATSGVSCNYVPTSPGLHLLRYIPVDGSTGKEGNITYVFLFAESNDCLQNSCDLVNNGGFENTIGCGQLGVFGSTVYCWSEVVGTADLFARNCTNCAVPTIFCLPAGDTWNNGASGNNNFLAMVGSGPANISEGAQTQLSSSLMPNTLYTLSFWARVADNYVGPFNGNNNVAHLVFAGAPGALSPSALTPTIPPGLGQLADISVPNNNKWNYFSVPISFTTNAPYSYLSIINASWLTTTGTYLFVDDISIKPTLSTATFVPPPAICRNQVITNLHTYVSAPGGSFSGPGVTFNVNTGFYEFNTGTNITSGAHLVAYNYTVNNCPGKLLQSITVSGVSVIAPPNYICSSQSVTLTATGANSFTWNTAAYSPSIVVSPSVTTIYTVTGSNPNSSCVVSTQTVLVTVLNSGATITPVSQTICAGSTATLTAIMPNTWGTVFWNTGFSGYTLVITPPTTVGYTVTCVNGENYCMSNESATVAISRVNATVNPVSQAICKGESVQITASGAQTYSWSTASQSQSIIVSPVQTMNFGVHGFSLGGSCHTYTSVLITVNPCTGIAKFGIDDQIKVYPNPARDVLFIETVLPVKSVLSNALGIVLVEDILPVGKSGINIGSFSNGIYLLKITNGSSTKDIKVIKID